MICEADTNVVVTEIAPRGNALVSGLLTPSTILIVQNVIKFQCETSFVLQDFPSDGTVPAEDVAVHTTDGVTPTGALGDVGIDDEFIVRNLNSKSEVVVPVGGILFGRSRVAKTIGIDFGEDGCLEPIVIN